MQRDYRDKLQVLEVDTLSVTAASAPEVVQGTAVDTQGIRAVVCAVVPDEAIGTDVIAFTIYECDTSGGTYTEVSSDKLLPTGGSRLLVDALADGSLMTVGVTGTKRYIKPAVSTTTVADDLTVSVTVIKVPELVEYDEDGIISSTP